MKYWERIKSFFHFILYDDSVEALIGFLIVSLVVLRYILFPFLGLIAGTDLPIVVVISNSMKHSDTWAEEPAQCTFGPCTQQEYYKEKGMWSSFDAYIFSSGFRKGDIILAHGHGSYDIGDVVIFQNEIPVIHRVVEKSNGDTFVTKGDNNPQPIESIGEDSISQKRIIGEAYGRIPLLGYVKLAPVDLLRCTILSSQYSDAEISRICNPYKFWN